MFVKAAIFLLRPHIFCLTKADKVQMQGHIKDMRAKVEETQHKKPEPQSTNILRLLEEMKEVQSNKTGCGKPGGTES